MAEGIHLRFILLLLLFLFNPAQSSTFSQDLQALRELKASIDPSSIHSTTCLGSWDFRADPCDSSSSSSFVCGISCSPAAPDPNNRRVITLILDGSGYNGTLPASIGSLSALQLLDISGNFFHGPIPETLGNLLSLVKLDMSKNLFSGPLPLSLSRLSNLSYLSLANNQLEGSIPASINNLKSLDRLFIHNNRLSGEIPSMAGLQQLSYLDASSNELTGLPEELPISLMQLSLRSNLLGGELPKNIASLRGLEVLDLSDNRFSGHLDSSLFELPSLQQLTLSRNQIASLGIPRNFSDVSELIAVDLSYNLLKGALPVFLANLRRLSALSLRYNSFSGTIPYEFASKAASQSSSSGSISGASSDAGAAVQPLVRLFLDGNYLIGEVPQPFLEIPGRFSASFIYNCLEKCPESYSFCQGGGQRPKSDCPVL